ncbi:MAG: MFS transporter [Nitrospiraceae bacterium]|nr:MFS transporter [Nitrospiraceae bacterium]
MTQSGSGPKGYYGWRIVALMFFTLFFTAGHGFYTFSVYLPRLIETLECDVFSATIAIAVWAVVVGLSSPFVGVFMQRFGARKVLITATAAAGAVAFLMSFVTALWHLYAIMALSGVAVAASTLVPAQTIVTVWFRKYRGRAMALTLMGIGLGGLLLPPATSYLIAHFGWRGAYRGMGLLFYIVVLPPLALLLRNRPSDVGQMPDGLALEKEEDATAHVPSGVSAQRAVRSMAFWLISGIYVLQLYAMSAIAMNTQVFAEHQGFSVMAAPLFMAFALGVTLPGRFITGVLCDRFSPKGLMAITGLFMAAGPLVLEVCVIKLGWTDFRAIGVFALLQGGAIAMNAVVLPVLIGRCFGEREFSKIMGLIMVGFAVGILLGPTSAGRIFDKTGSYEIAFFVCAACALLSVLLALLIRPNALHAEFQTAQAPD